MHAYTDGEQARTRPDVPSIVQNALVERSHSLGEQIRAQLDADTKGGPAGPPARTAPSRPAVPRRIDSPASFNEMRADGHSREPIIGFDLSTIQIHEGPVAAASAAVIGASAYTLGEHIVFGHRNFQPNSPSGRHLLRHEIGHVLQHRALGTPPDVVARRINPEDVSSEMIGVEMVLAQPFTDVAITLAPGTRVIVESWVNSNPLVTVRVPTPHLGAGPHDVPKYLLRPITHPVAGIAPYDPGVESGVRDLHRGQQRLDDERARAGGPRPGEVTRLEGLQAARQNRVNRLLIQGQMFNRFDSNIRHWVDHYNTFNGFAGAAALDPNLVKSMLFQESEMGTAGRNLEDPPRVAFRSRFNLAQVIDSAAAALLTMMRETDPTLISKFHLASIDADRVSAQNDLRTLAALPSRTPAQASRLAELRLIESRSSILRLSFSETFMWMYRAPGQSAGFDEAAAELLDIAGARRHLDYDFWIRTAVSWLFLKHSSVGSWTEAIRAYNGSGPAARRYRDTVTARSSAARAAQSAGQTFIPSR